MKVSIKPGRCSGEVCAPPSKSYAHRMLICAALADGESTVRGLARSEDMLATLDCIAALGAEYALDGDTVTVKGGKNRTAEEPCSPAAKAEAPCASCCP